MLDTADFVLDTSAIRALPTPMIRAALAKGHSLLVSPISVWEMLAHFDDGSIDFQQLKGWLRKAQLCQMVEHPDAESREAIGVAEHIPPQARIAWREREAALAILSIFERANSPADVHAGTFRDSLGNLHTTAQCGDNAKRTLWVLRDRHRSFVRPLIEAFDEEFRRLGRNPRGPDPLTDGEFFNHLVREVQRIASTADTPTVANLEGRLFSVAFARIGHAIETVLRCIRDAASVDPNDYGDALLAQHIDLDTRRVLVTVDHRALDALARAEQRLRRYSAEHVLELRQEPLAISCDAFRSFVDVRSSQ